MTVNTLTLNTGEQINGVDIREAHEPMETATDMAKRLWKIPEEYKVIPVLVFNICAKWHQFYPRKGK